MLFASGFPSFEDEEKTKHKEKFDEESENIINVEADHQKQTQRQQKSRPHQTRKTKSERTAQSPMDGEEDELRLVTNTPQTESWNVNIVAVL